MSAQSVPHLTVEQYLEAERAAEFRSEYINGQMFAMSGGSRNHARIALNASTRLAEQLRGQRCEAAAGGLRLFCTEHSVLTYPDIVITCGPDHLLDDRRDTLTDATAIIEVLSPSTQGYDRGDKFRFYRSLPSFAEYLLVAQDTLLAEHHVRQPDGSWLFREYKSPETEIELTSINCRLKLQDLYERVEFE